MNTGGVHVQHRLTNVRREWGAEFLPHLIAITVALFIQVVVLKAERSNAHALDLNEHVPVIDSDVSVGVTKEKVIVIFNWKFCLDHDTGFGKPVLPFGMNHVAFLKDVESLKTK
jgi:hypothetical protein